MPQALSAVPIVLWGCWNVGVTLVEILGCVAGGGVPELDGVVTVVPQPSPRDLGVIALTGHSVVFADLDPAWVHARLPDGDLSAPLGPSFLHALELETGRRVDNLDLLTLATPLNGTPRPLATSPDGGTLSRDPAASRDGGSGLSLVEVTSREHPRVVRALAYRDEVRVWTCAGGVLTVGRGVAGRWEVAVEVEEEHRGRGLGRLLARTARHLVPHPLWAQIAPGNAASVKAFLAAGFVPVGAEALLVNAAS